MKSSANAHEHLISLLATYEQYKRFYLIFPCANFDLKGYWEKRNPKPKEHCVLDRYRRWVG